VAIPKPKLRELKEALTALFTGPYTSKFPKVMPEMPEHFRGTPTYVPDECVGCGSCGQVCPAGAITIVDRVNDEGEMIRYIERNWGSCIFCSQCYVYCITGKGIELDPDFEKSAMSPEDIVDSHEKELLFCENCGEVITAVDHAKWCAKQLGELAFGNQNLHLVRFKELGLVEEGTGRKEGETEERDRYMKILCPNCRASYILTDEWGAS